MRQLVNGTELIIHLILCECVCAIPSCTGVACVCCCWVPGFSFLDDSHVSLFSFLLFFFSCQMHPRVLRDGFPRLLLLLLLLHSSCCIQIITAAGPRDWAFIIWMRGKLTFQKMEEEGRTEPVRCMPCLALLCFNVDVYVKKRKKKTPTDIFISSTKHTFYYYSFILLTSQCSKGNSNSREEEEEERNKQQQQQQQHCCGECVRYSTLLPHGTHHVCGPHLHRIHFIFFYFFNRFVALQSGINNHN